MDPELELMAGEMTASERRVLAKKMARWTKQLEFTALILEIDSAPRPKASLKFLTPRCLLSN